MKSFTKNWRKGALPGEDFVEVGRDIEEGKIAAKMLVDAGYDALNADVGTYDAWYWNHPPMYHKKGMYLPYNEILKGVIDVPVITAGRMENPDLAAEAIEKGQYLIRLCAIILPMFVLACHVRKDAWAVWQFTHKCLVL